MRLPFFPTAVSRFALLLAFAFAAPCASAQDIFVTPIPNAPFSAVVNVQRTRVQRDGAILSLKTFRNIGRDSHGRIHNEARVLLPASSTATPQLVQIHLYDPQTRISANLNPRERTFWTQTMNHPPSTQPPALRFAAPTGEAPQNDFAREEDLGIHEIEGVSARGIRETQIIPAESSGSTGKEIVVTDEYWYSDELRIYVLIKHSDSGKETVTMTVAQITRTEPDASLFEIPEGYKPGRAANQ